MTTVQVRPFDSWLEAHPSAPEDNAGKVGVYSFSENKLICVGENLGDAMAQVANRPLQDLTFHAFPVP